MTLTPLFAPVTANAGRHGTITLYYDKQGEWSDKEGRVQIVKNGKHATYHAVVKGKKIGNQFQSVKTALKEAIKWL